MPTRKADAAPEAPSEPPKRRKRVNAENVQLDLTEVSVEEALPKIRRVSANPTRDLVAASMADGRPRGIPTADPDGVSTLIRRAVRELGMSAKIRRVPADDGRTIVKFQVVPVQYRGPRKAE